MKYPRVPHIAFSHPSADDIVTREDIFGKRWVVTEKIDGAQVSFEFEGGNLIARNRNTDILGGKKDRQFHAMPAWVREHWTPMSDACGESNILFGEWLFHTHTVAYDRLPDWFVAFDLYDKERGVFFPFAEFEAKAKRHGFATVPVLCDGVVASKEQLLGLVARSKFSTHRAEGLVLHAPAGDFRCKYVTGEFRAQMEARHGHWKYLPRARNAVAKAARPAPAQTRGNNQVISRQW